jgi:hypothetical protein
MVRVLRVSLDLSEKRRLSSLTENSMKRCRFGFALYIPYICFFSAHFVSNIGTVPAWLVPLPIN